MFGLAAGIALSFGASMLSAVVGFAIARALGREAVAELTGPRLDRAEDVCATGGGGRRGRPADCRCPSRSCNYGAGVSAVSLRDYLVGTAIGIVPGTVGYTALGPRRRGRLDRARLVRGGRRAARRVLVLARRMSRRYGMPG